MIRGGHEITNWAGAGGSKQTAELAGVESGQWQIVVASHRSVTCEKVVFEDVLMYDAPTLLTEPANAAGDGDGCA